MGRRRRPGLGAGRFWRALAAAGVLLVTLAQTVAASPPPPEGLAAAASFVPVTQYLGDANGTVYAFSVHNTGAVAIGAVQIARPSGVWSVTECPDAPAGWTTRRAGKSCRFQSLDGAFDDIPPGSTSSDFAVRAKTGTAPANATASWVITVSLNNRFDGQSRFKPASAEGTGLTATAHAFKILDAIVGDAAVGSACPSATPGNHSAEAGSTRTIVLCGRNGSSVAATTVAGQSSLSGSFVTSNGTFAGGTVGALSGNVVLARWVGAAIVGSPGTSHDLVASVGASTFSNSPPTTLDDGCPAPSGGVDCIDNGGYEATDGGGNTPPVATDDVPTVSEDSTGDIVAVLANDTDADLDTLSVSVVDTTGTTGQVTNNGTNVTYDPNGQFESLNTGQTATDTFTYTVSDGNGGTDTATVTVTISGVTDGGGDVPPTAVDDAATVGEDAGANAIDVLSNDPNADGGQKVIALASDPANGTVVLTGGSPGAQTGLTYEPDTNFCNDPPGTSPDTFTYTLNGGSTATVSITVTCLNDAPVVTTSAGSASYTENASPTVVDSGLAIADVDGGSVASATVSISGGSAGDRLGFTPQFGITDTDASPSVLALSGTASIADYQTVLRSVTFDSTSDDPGIATRTISFVVNDGTQDSNTATRDVTMTAANDPPTDIVLSPSSVDENEPAGTVVGTLTATDADAGDTSTFSLVAGTGDDDNGSFQIDGTSLETNAVFDFETDDEFSIRVQADDGSGTFAKSLVITIVDVNEAPDAVDDTGAAFGTNEDSSFTTGNVLTNDTDVDGDTLSIQSVDTTGTLGVVTNNSDGTFGYDPNGQFEALDNGDTTTDTFTYTASDGNGGTDTATVTITITGITDGGGNSPPVAVDDGGASFTTDEASSFTTGNVLTNDTDADASDTLTVLSFDDSATLGTVTDNGNGTFGYDPNGAWEALGVTDSDVDTFEYTVTDGNGGTDTAVVTITVNGLNDAPDAVDDSESTDEDTQTTFDPRGNDTDPDTSDALTITLVGTPTNGGTAAVVNAGSQIQFSPGTSFQDLGTGAARNTTFTYTISDGNGGTDTATVTMTVNGANDAPVADDETFATTDAAIGNTTLIVNDPSDGAPTGPGGPAKSISGDILAGDTDVDGPGALTISAGTFATNDGGSVVVEADGDFVFRPAAGTSCTDASDSFDYTVSDGTLTDIGRVTVNISGCVWYVRNNAAAGGDGRSATPFNTLAAAQAPSAAGSTIFVYAGDGTTTGLGGGVAGAQFTLDANQTLIGETVALVVNGTTLTTAGARPALGLGLVLGGGDTVTGLSVASNAVSAIQAGGGNANGTISDVIISSNFGGINLQGTSGTWNITSVTVTTTFLDGILLSSAGTVNFTPTGTISVASAGGRAIAFSGATTVLSGTIDSVTASGTATSGILLDDTAGSLTIDDINISMTGIGIDIDSANGITINNTGDGDVSSTGIAVRATTVTSNPSDMPDISLDTVSSTGGTAGILLNDIGNGTFSASGGSLSGHTVAEIQIIGGTGDVTYPGTIGNGTGLSLDIQSHTAGTMTFAGSITDTNDAGGGISITGGAAAASTVLSGQITLNTASGNGFVVQDAGTLSATNAANTVVTTTGTGVDIANTTISASHVTFQSVNVDGSDIAPTNGIRVAGTGSLGHFAITGTGSAGTGGVIQDTAGDGILLVGTLAPSLSWMTVTSNLGNGIHGGDGTAGGVVSGAGLANLTVSGNGDNTGAEDGILFQGLVGTATFSSLNVSGSARHNVAVINNAGTLTSLTISGSQIHDNNIVAGSNGIDLFADLTATMTVSIGSTSFTENRVTGVHAATSGAGNLTVSINGLGAAGGDPVTFTNNFVSVDFAHGSTGSLTGTLQNAKITNAASGCSTAAGLPCGAPVNVFLGNGAGSSSGSILRATVTNTVINNGGSGSAPGIWFHTGTPVRGHARLLLTNNTISNVDERGIAVEGGGCNTVNVPGATCDATVDSTITGNTISLTTAAASDAIHFNVGTAGTLAGNNDTMNYCAEINNNSLDTDAGGFAARMRQRSLTTIRLPGYAGSATDTAAVQSFLAGKNTEPDGDPYSAAVQAGGGGFQNTTGGAACLTPAS